MLAQRWILVTDVEVNLYGKNDSELGIGSGLSDIEAGLRLSYEITRKFAPYVGQTGFIFMEMQPILPAKKGKMLMIYVLSSAKEPGSDELI
jgi:hypothetical protein